MWQAPRHESHHLGMAPGVNGCTLMRKTHSNWSVTRAKHFMRKALPVFSKNATLASPKIKHRKVLEGWYRWCFFCIITRWANVLFKIFWVAGLLYNRAQFLLIHHVHLFLWPCWIIFGCQIFRWTHLDPIRLVTWIRKSPSENQRQNTGEMDSYSYGFIWRFPEMGMP